MHQSHSASNGNHHLHSKGGSNGVQRVNFGRAMIQALEQLQLVKKHVSEQSDKEIRPVYSYNQHRIMLKASVSK